VPEGGRWSWNIGGDGGSLSDDRRRRCSTFTACAIYPRTLRRYRERWKPLRTPRMARFRQGKFPNSCRVQKIETSSEATLREAEEEGDRGAQSLEAWDKGCQKTTATTERPRVRKSRTAMEIRGPFLYVRKIKHISGIRLSLPTSQSPKTVMETVTHTQRKREKPRGSSERPGTHIVQIYLRYPSDCQTSCSSSGSNTKRPCLGKQKKLFPPRQPHIAVCWRQVKTRLMNGFFPGSTGYW